MSAPPPPTRPRPATCSTTEQFDLMLCDVTMPGESGFSLLAHAHEAHPDLAVIMVTAVDSPHTPSPRPAMAPTAASSSPSTPT